jgi:hypothetical protein
MLYIQFSVLDRAPFMLIWRSQDSKRLSMGSVPDGTENCIFSTEFVPTEICNQLFLRHEAASISPLSKTEVNDLCNYPPPTLPYVIMALCLIKHRDNFPFHLFNFFIMFHFVLLYFLQKTTETTLLSARLYVPPLPSVLGSSSRNTSPQPQT